MRVRILWRLAWLLTDVLFHRREVRDGQAVSTCKTRGQCSRTIMICGMVNLTADIASSVDGFQGVVLDNLY